MAEGRTEEPLRASQFFRMSILRVPLFQNFPCDSSAIIQGRRHRAALLVIFGGSMAIAPVRSVVHFGPVPESDFGQVLIPYHCEIFFYDTDHCTGTTSTTNLLRFDRLMAESCEPHACAHATPAVAAGDLDLCGAAVVL